MHFFLGKPLANGCGAEYLVFVSPRSLETREKYTNWDNLFCLSLYIFWAQSHLCLLLRITFFCHKDSKEQLYICVLNFKYLKGIYSNVMNIGHIRQKQDSTSECCCVYFKHCIYRTLRVWHCGCDTAGVTLRVCSQRHHSTALPDLHQWLVDRPQMLLTLCGAVTYPFRVVGGIEYFALLVLSINKVLQNIKTSLKEDLHIISDSESPLHQLPLVLLPWCLKNRQLFELKMQFIISFKFYLFCRIGTIAIMH